VQYQGKPLVWMHGEIKTPPFSREARLEAGFLLRKLQLGESLSLPQSRPMPEIGNACYEIRINDKNKTWRIIYSLEVDAVVILEIFAKKTNKTPRRVIQISQRRLYQYHEVMGK
jgi:phage-related protein